MGQLLAVVIVVGGVLGGTYLARVAQPPHPILGYALLGLAISIAGVLWKSK